MKKHGFLDLVDNKAEQKGEGAKTLWQAIKFVFVSLIVTVIQLVLVNVLYAMLKDFNEPLPEVLENIFSETTMGENNSNWGYVLPFLVSNLIANMVGYFVNKKKTFKSNAPLWHFALYIVILFSLILLTTWVQGVIVNALTNTRLSFFVSLAPTIAALAAGTIQMLTLFPLQKFVLLRENKDIN